MLEGTSQAEFEFMARVHSARSQHIFTPKKVFYVKLRCKDPQMVIFYDQPVKTSRFNRVKAFQAQCQQKIIYRALQCR